MELTAEVARRFYEDLEPYHNFDDSLEQEFDFAEVPEEGTMLDVGCGAGHWLRYVIERRPRLRVWGLDYSPKALKKAALNAPGAVLACSDVIDHPFTPNAFDLITCWGSLEHFYDPIGAVRAMARISPRLVLLVPLDPSSEADQPVFFMGDLSAWITLLESNGWVVRRVAPFSAWRGNLYLIETRRK